MATTDKELKAQPPLVAVPDLGADSPRDVSDPGTKTTTNAEVHVHVREAKSLSTRVKRFLFHKKLDKDQVELVTVSSVKNRTTWVLLIAAFVDLGGAVLLAGGYPAMCANAPGAALLGEAPGAFPSSDFAFVRESDGPPSLDYSMTINLITVAGSAGGIFSSYIAGLASDRFGRKLVIQSCLIGGVVSYILMFIAGFWARNCIQAEARALA